MTEAINLAPLYAALAKAQGAFLPIEKNRSVSIRSEKGNYQFRYADLEEILSKTRGALSANGLSLFQPMVETSDGPVLQCILAHSSGATITSSMVMTASSNLRDPKQFGALVTYFRRYLVTSLLGVAADDDLDEDGQEIADTRAPQRRAGKPDVQQPRGRSERSKDVSEQPSNNPAIDPVAQGSAGFSEPIDSVPATPGEIAYMNRKVADSGKSLAEICQQAGVNELASLDGLTKAMFSKLKQALV